MNEDMSNLINNFSSMIKNNEIPAELSDMLKNFSNSNSINKDNNNHKEDISSRLDNSPDALKSNNNINFEDIKKIIEKYNYSNNSNGSHNDSENNNSFDIDINTLLKIKSIINAMNNQKDDPRANLLKSLKPYLKESRKDKVDQYIKIFSMEKIFEQLNPLGGDKKNDV